MTSHFFVLQVHPAERHIAELENATPLVTVEVRCLRAEGALEVCYDIRTSLAPLLQPLTGTTPGRRDGLWRHTCCELFMASVQHEGPYLEFNFAPCGDWAAYAFDDLRRGMRPFFWSASGEDEIAGRTVPLVRRYSSSIAAGSRPQGAVLHRLQVEARLPAPRPSGAFRLSPTVVLETSAGVSHWALRHPAEQPDFHHPAGFSDPLSFSWDPAA